MNRLIRFRGKNKDIGWVYGQLVYDINGNPYIIQEVEQDSSYGLEEIMLYATMWYRVEPETIGQFIGANEYGEIYENMKLYDEYEEEYCTIRFDEADCNYILVYGNTGIAKRLENLDGLMIVEV